MALSLVRQGIETESLIGSEDTQVLLRAEAMVSGAGREAVKILMADAYLALGAVPQSEWTTYRLTGEALAALGS